MALNQRIKIKTKMSNSLDPSSGRKGLTSLLYYYNNFTDKGKIYSFKLYRIPFWKRKKN